MKRLENRETDIKKGHLAEGEPPVDYCALIRLCLDKAPKGGFTRKDLVDRGRIEAALDTTPLEFEDADAENLKRIVGQMCWALRHSDLLTFHDAVAAL